MLQRQQRVLQRRLARPPGVAPSSRAAETMRLRRQLGAQERLQQLQQQAGQRRLTRTQRRELRRLQRVQRQIERRQAGEQRLLPQWRARRAAHITPQQAARGRFASAFRGKAHDRAQWRRAHRAARLGARAAWRLGLFAAHVPWYGPIYWPYANDDIFYYTFWPNAYEPGYWAYVYDDFFDGIFFPYGAPEIEYAYGLPYQGPYVGETTGSVPGRGVPGRVSPDARQLCEDQAKGIAAWPFERIEQAVRPSDDQKKLLENLKTAAGEAAAQFESACPEAVPMTPPGRLQAMTMRLQAMLDTVKAVRPALTAFYDALSDEQKARFNEIGPELAKERRRPAVGKAEAPSADCGGEKAGLSNLAVERIEAAVRPTQSQFAALDRLDAAMQKAVDTLREACPTTTPLTPVGRLEAMQKRLEAMIEAGNGVRPALADFYAALNDEQKAKFNRLGRETARSGG
jgi:hypothetical protein